MKRKSVTLEMSVEEADAVLSAVNDQLLTLQIARENLRDLLDRVRPLPESEK